MTQPPPGTEPSIRLARLLRDLFDRTGYSMRELEHLTGISDSSWSRYLSGRTLAPWSAVTALCRLANQDSKAMRQDWQTARANNKGTTDGGLALPPGQQLAARLRQLRRESGQSLKQLETSLHVSDSALSRYLSGHVIPPWTVIQALCRLREQDPQPLRRLWERARKAQRPADPPTLTEAHAAVAAPPSLPAPNVLGHGSLPTWAPHRVGHFAGRAHHLSTLAATLTRADGERRLVVLQGPPGIGKAALARELMHVTQDAFPDGRLWLDLRGDDPRTALSASGALSSALQQLGMTGGQLPDQFDPRVGLYQSVFDGRRMMVVLDNAFSTAQVLPLLPRSERCAVVVCSRRVLGALATHRAVEFRTLDPLTSSESMSIWQQAVGPERASADREATDQLLALCNGFPLALRVAAALLTSGGQSAADLLAQLRDDRGGLPALSVEDGARSVRAVFSSAYRSLRPHAQRVFRALGTHPVDTFTVETAADVSQLPARQVSAHLRNLADHHLIEKRPDGGYRMHGLIRWYARGLAHADLYPPATAQVTETIW